MKIRLVCIIETNYRFEDIGLEHFPTFIKDQWAQTAAAAQGDTLEIRFCSLCRDDVELPEDWPGTLIDYKAEIGEE